MREILFYETDFGDKPVERFLSNLEPSARAKVVRSLEMLRMFPVVPAKFWYKLSDQKLWSIRAEYAGNIYRILATTKKATRSFCCTASKRNRKKRRSRIWKLLSKGRGGIFNGTDTCERRSRKISSAPHGERFSLCRGASSLGTWRSRCVAQRGSKAHPGGIGKTSAGQSSRHRVGGRRDSPRASGLVGSCAQPARPAFFD